MNKSKNSSNHPPRNPKREVYPNSEDEFEEFDDPRDWQRDNLDDDEEDEWDDGSRDDWDYDDEDY